MSPRDVGFCTVANYLTTCHSECRMGFRPTHEDENRLESRTGLG